MTYWEGKKVLITGDAGFLGSHIVEQLYSMGVHPEDLYVPRNC
jgi:nucleoside-diphosphate-sugar epimerase